MSRQLYLLGGSTASDITAEEFVPLAGGKVAKIALLLGGGTNWRKYVPVFTEPWTHRGVSQYYVVVPGEDGQLDLDNVVAKLHDATGIFIGGGHIGTYRKLYTAEPMRSLLRECYSKGIPIAGCSAGALIMPQICAFHPGENEDGSLVAEGLDLINDMIVGVHFTAQNVLGNVLRAMATTRTATGWGIDDAACAVFEDGAFKRALGESVHEITMTDFATQAYVMNERN